MADHTIQSLFFASFFSLIIWIILLFWFDDLVDLVSGIGSSLDSGIVDRVRTPLTPEGYPIDIDLIAEDPTVGPGNFVEVLISYLRHTFLLLAGLFFFLGAFLWAFVARLGYKHLLQHLENEYILLKVKVLRITNKPLRLMENIFESIHINSGEGTWYSRYWKAKHRPIHSFEVISTEGDVSLCIRTVARFRKVITTAVYAQYSDAEITEIDDYAEKIYFNRDYKIWGCEFKLSKPDIYPIHTYVDSKEDPLIMLNADNPVVFDPLNFLFELGGTLGKGEHLWFQITARTKKYKRRASYNPFSADFWNKQDVPAEMKVEQQKLLQKLTKEAGSEKSIDRSILTDATKDVLKSMERNATKHAYEIGIRGVYMARQEVYKPATIIGLVNVMKPFGIRQKNRFSPYLGHRLFNFPWQQIPTRIKKINNEMFHYYRNRLFFFPPATYRRKRKPFLLSTEELATIFHFPTMLSTTPNLERLETKQVEPPSNLPV